MLHRNPVTIWYPDSLGAFLNRWFSTYEQARRSLESDGGYLFPYRNQFFICESEAIRSLGLDPQDPDWKKIGWDCAHPTDFAAHRRLCEKREHAAREGVG